MLGTMCMHRLYIDLLGKPATQSTTHGSGATADRAIDGNTNGNFPSGSCTHTNGAKVAPYSWWKVDLGTASYNTGP